jgi:hypothetical protein
MTEEQWSDLAGRAGAVLNLGIKEKAWLKHSKMARLIAATPFLAACEKAKATAFSHLILYLVAMDESARNIYFHSPADDGDVYTRLFPIGSFMGGDPGVIRCFLDLTALTMLAGYKKDAGEDRRWGKYNPLNEGKWDYDAMSEQLIERIRENSRPEIEAIYTVEDALKGYWRS